jgi:hypothetical protein
MREHQSSFVVEGSPAQVWHLWFGSIPTERSAEPFVIEHDNVRIEIIHPGDHLHDGLVRHCYYPVPRYLLSGGVAESWELVSDVVVKESCRYRTITKPPFAVSEGRQWLEDLGDGRTRVHFWERYEITNRLLRPILEGPVFRMISINNDKVIEEGIRMGLEALGATDR